DRQAAVPETTSSDYLFVRLNATRPLARRAVHGRELMSIFRLDLDSDTLAEPLRHDFGSRPNDIGLIGRSVFLFYSDPTTRATKGTMQWREYQRFSWRLLAPVEFSQYQQAMAKYLTSRLKQLTLRIRRVHNPSPAFVRTLLKAMFSNTALDSLAAS